MGPEFPLPRWMFVGLFVLLVFVLGGSLAALVASPAHAETTYQQRQADALLERLVRTQEEQTRALQEIARHLGRK